MTPQLVSVIMSDITRVNYDGDDDENESGSKKNNKEGTMEDLIGWVKGGAGNRK